MIARRVDAPRGRPALEEKIGRLGHYSAGIPTGPGTTRTGYPEQIALGQAGSFQNLMEEVAPLHSFPGQRSSGCASE